MAAWRAAWVIAAALAATPATWASSLAAALRTSSTDYCSKESRLTVQQQDRLLRFAAIARRELQASGRPVAIVSRSGLDLQRFGQRYSHAGISLRSDAALPWAVRQLYYACDERRPRLFDQGLAGFVLGTDNPDAGFLSIVLLPDGPQQDALLQAASDKALALGLLADRYSANAYAFSTLYQNCNQWLAEMLGAAWTGKAGRPATREDSQQGLRQLGYRPQTIDVNSHLTMWAASFVPLIRLDDHPEDDKAALRLQISLPSSIEAFVRERVPQAERLEICQAEDRIVVRRGWQPLGDRCEAGPGDQLIPLD